jgi:flagellar biosynthesis anti-sigma factor FlgM
MNVQRVDGPNGARRVEATTPSRSARLADTDGPASSDRVEVSTEARRIAALAEAAAALSGVRNERVEPLRHAIDEDTYRVDPRAVARAILEHEDGFAR